MLKATPTSGQAPLTVSFDASASSDPDGTLSSFVWDFGDGSGGGGAQVSHVYGVGSFTATLTVTDDRGATASAETVITVAKSAPSQGPIALLKATPTSGQAPLEVTFDASASSGSGPDGKIASFGWDFGDGSSASGVQVSHVYAAGTFTATLTLTDDQGATASAKAVITVTDAPPPDDRGDILGTITLSNTLAEGQAAQAAPGGSLKPLARAAELPTVPSEGEFVPGEVIVQFRAGLSTQALRTLPVAGQSLERVRPLPVADTYLYRLAPGSAGAAGTVQATALRTTALQIATLQMTAALAERPGVRAVTPNRIYHALKTPDDEFYSLQWHHPAINLPQAWDLTTGSAETVVAVVDTGILGDAAAAGVTHPDFIGRILPGYDFIADAAAAGDGGGRDADPYDQGTFQSNGTHGSHVTGIIAANSDDGVGVAGIDWAAKILPVRVLGTEGSGTLSDILDGIAWAAGLSVEGVPANPNPADVINLSLGGGGPCNAVEEALFDEVISRGTLIVVAAGNGSEDASELSPAGCGAVLTVGAVDFGGRRAPYSNFGDKLDLMAPGGDIGADANGDTYPDGVLSTVYDDISGSFYWDFLQGTSMAAPHVAGVAALLKAVDPTLTQADVETIFKATARPRTAEACNGQNRTDLGVSDCGAGLVDAFAAVQAAKSGSLPPPPPPGGELSFSPSRLDFGTSKTELELKLLNPGGGSLDWRFDTFISDPDNPGGVGDGVTELSAQSGVLPAGGSQTITVRLDRSQAGASGSYHLDLGFEAGNAAKLLPLFFSKGEAVPPPSGSLDGTLTVACFIVGDGCDEDKSRVEEVKNRANSAPYGFTDLGAGRYRLIAWKDVNDNNTVDTGDYFGFYSRDGLGATEVTPPASEVDFPVSAVSSGDAPNALPPELTDFLAEVKRRR